MTAPAQSAGGLPLATGQPFGRVSKWCERPSQKARIPAPPERGSLSRAMLVELQWSFRPIIELRACCCPGSVMRTEGAASAATGTARIAKAINRAEAGRQACRAAAAQNDQRPRRIRGDVRRTFKQIEDIHRPPTRPNTHDKREQEQAGDHGRQSDSVSGNGDAARRQANHLKTLPHRYQNMPARPAIYRSRRGFRLGSGNS